MASVSCIYPDLERPCSNGCQKDGILIFEMGHLVWNVGPEIFGFGPFRVRWYGLFFALGFVVDYAIMAQFYRKEERPIENLSNLFLYLFLGTLIGARLGHVLLYQPDYYLARPWEILMIWQGGLASHGGFGGVMIAVYLYVKTYREMSFLELAVGHRVRPRRRYPPAPGDALRGLNVSSVLAAPI